MEVENMDTQAYYEFFSVVATVGSTFTALFIAVMFWLIDKRFSAIDSLKRKYWSTILRLGAACLVFAGLSLIAIIGTSATGQERFNVAQAYVFVIYVLSGAAIGLVLSAVLDMAGVFQKGLAR
jgi:hypothetical protein